MTQEPREKAVPGGGGPLAQWTTRRWLTAGVAVALVVLAALAGTGTWVLARSNTISDRLVDHNSPALITSVRLEGALLDQETGVRGYGLTGEPSFLEPYTTGLRDERTYDTRLHTLITDDGTAGRDLLRAERQARDWQEFIARPVAAAPPGRPVPLATGRAARGKVLFDRLRGTYEVLQADLLATRNATRADLRSIQTVRNWVFLFIAAVIVALAALVFAGLRRGVNGPLERLSGDVRRVAAGDFGHRVDVAGPADIRRLAADVEGMRRRLADQIAFADEAAARLSEQAEELRRSNAELEQFAYVASHDLQEPLRKVASFCQLLERRYAPALDDRAKQYIGYAVDGATRMQILINDLLAFSRVGRLHTSHQRVDLDKVLGRTTDALSVAIEESGARVTHDPLPVVDGDGTQLNMLFQNLVSNALKFRAPGRTPELRVSCERDGDLWRLAVSDNGIGIAPEYAEKIFVIFQRLHTRDEYAGTGIGLALCKKIVEYHGGTIALDTAHEPGTRIVFTLPVAADDPEQERAREETAGQPAEAGAEAEAAGN